MPFRRQPSGLAKKPLVAMTDGVLSRLDDPTKNITTENKDMMIQWFKQIFGVRRDERWQVAVALLVMVALNVLFIQRLSPLFMQEGFGPYWKVFMREFHLSGYDPLTYLGVTDWGMVYNIYRHPLLALMIYPLWLVNSGLSALLGINCVQYVVAVPVVASSLYSYLFTYRIHRELIGLKRADATLMSVFYFTMAYVMLSVIVPDHFTISMFLLLMTLYVAGLCMRQGKRWTWWQTALLFVVTAGVTLSNGIKTFLSALFVCRWRFFQWRHLLLGVLLPAALLWGFSRWEYRQYVWPKEQARAAAKQRKAEQQKEQMAQLTGEARQQAEMKQKKRKEVLARQAAKTGKPMKKVGFLSWTDTTTPRLQTIYENLFGETIQFHEDHFLGDTLVFRPVFVPYRGWYAYAVEGIIMLLFVMGCWAGRRQKVWLLAMTYFLFDMGIHLVLGFGINEIFIMAPHWLFVVPMAVACLMRQAQGKWHTMLRGAVALLTLYLIIYNGVQLVDFLCSPINATL